MSGTALQGNLSTFSLEDVLRFVEEKGQTGTLAINDGQEQRYVYFQTGRMVCLNGLLSGAKIGRLLYRRGILLRSQYESVIQKENVEFFEALSSVMDLRRPELRSVLADCLRIQRDEETVTLFSLTEGDFRFLTEAVKCPTLAAQDVAIGEFLETGKALSKQWKAVESALPNKSLYPHLPDLDSEAFESFSPIADFWFVLSVVDGRHSIQELAEMSPWGSFATLSGIASFVNQGVLTLKDHPFPKRVFSAAKEEVPIPHETASFLSSFLTKEQAPSFQPKTTTGMAAVFLEQILAGYRGRKEFSLKEGFLQEAWARTVLEFPLSDMILVTDNGADVRGLEGFLARWDDSETAQEVIASSTRALKGLVDQLHAVAVDLLGDKKALGIYTKAYTSFSHHTDWPLLPEQIPSLGLEK